VEAADYVTRLEAALGLDPGARVLDFGCGFGFIAELLVLSDLLTHPVDPLREVVEMLLLSARRGCLLRVLRKAFGELRYYARTRRGRPLCRIELGDLRERAASLGLAMHVPPSNLTYRKRRATAVLSMPAAAR
jgi:hypothetical protein